MGILTRRDTHKNSLFEWIQQSGRILSDSELKKYIFMLQNAFMPCGLCDQLKLANFSWFGDTLNELLLETRADQEVFASANNFK